MTKKIYKKSALLSTVLLIVFFSLAYGSTVELTPVADGTYLGGMQTCGRDIRHPGACTCTASGSFGAGINVFFTGSKDCDESYSFFSEDKGIIEFDISSVNGLFQPGQINATLTLTIISVMNVDAYNYIYLYDMKDANEYGVINSINTSGYIGTATYDSQVKPGDKITFDITQALAHDMFDPNQSTFSGFVLTTDEYADADCSFYDHTSVDNAPRLTIKSTSLLTTTTTIQQSTTTTTTPATVVELSSFTATPKASEVILQWNTESETDNAGFNIYRAESENGAYIKINAALIPAKGSSTQGATYEFTDTNVQNRKTYYYKLEDIDLNGTSTMHGPVSATPRLIYGIR